MRCQPTETDNGLANPRGRERRGVQDDGLDRRCWHWFPQCPGPRMSSPGRKDCPACLTKRDARDRPGTPSPLINPVHACSLRSARHPDPSAPKAPISSALLQFFLYIHGSYQLLNMPLFHKYTMFIIDCLFPTKLPKTWTFISLIHAECPAQSRHSTCIG